jgi:hypothetical protein
MPPLPDICAYAGWTVLVGKRLRAGVCGLGSAVCASLGMYSGW